MLQFFLATALQAASVPALPAGPPPPLAVIANAGIPVDTLSLAELRKVFLGDRQFWSGDLRVTLLVPRPGWAEHRPKHDWWGDFSFICRKMLAESGIAPDSIRAVGASAIGPCMLPVDDNGEALSNAVLYGVDTRAAKEIEDLLFAHPKVADVAVVGVPDPASGERACAVVVCVEGEELTFLEMVEHLRAADLTPQKLPEQLEIVPALPRNPSGKVLKRELRQQFS